MRRKKAKLDTVSKVIVVVVVIALVAIALLYSGFLPETFTVTSPSGTLPETPGDTPTGNEVELSLSDFEIFSLLEVLLGKSLSYAEVSPYISALHMKVYGRNDMSAYELLQWFEAEYTSEGWSSYGTTFQSGTGWVAYHEIWTKVLNARSVSIGEGAAVTSALGYDTIYLTAYGPSTTYLQFWDVVK